MCFFITEKSDEDGYVPLRVCLRVHRVVFKTRPAYLSQVTSEYGKDVHA